VIPLPFLLLAKMFLKIGRDGSGNSLGTVYILRNKLECLPDCKETNNYMDRQGLILFPVPWAGFKP
jgi:hypothetical protein